MWLLIRQTTQSYSYDLLILTCSLLVRFARHLRQRVLFDTGTGDKRRLLHVQAVSKDLGDDVNLTLAALHAFTGCDTTSAFMRKGKVKPLKLLIKHPEFIPAC